jgi:adenine phosphoribosyltransferase
VIATGGTAVAACRLVELLGGEVAGVGVIIDLAFLGGSVQLAGRDVVALLTYDEP